MLNGLMIGMTVWVLISAMALLFNTEQAFRWSFNALGYWLFLCSVGATSGYWLAGI